MGDGAARHPRGGGWGCQISSQHRCNHHGECARGAGVCVCVIAAVAGTDGHGCVCVCVCVCVRVRVWVWVWALGSKSNENSSGAVGTPPNYYGSYQQEGMQGDLYM